VLIYWQKGLVTFLNNFIKNYKFIFAIYFSILNVVINSHFVNLNIGILYLVIFLTAFFCASILENLPFIVYPFMYLLRAQNPENLTLVLLPELTVIFSCFYLGYYILEHRSGLKVSSEIYLLVAYGILIFFINLYHVNDMRYIPIIFRQYLLPIIFLCLYIIYNNLKENKRPYINGISFSILSFGVVSAISLLIISSILRIPRFIPELFPYLNYSPDLTPNEVRSLGYDTISPTSGTFEELLEAGLMQSTRRIPFIGWVFRLNLYAGGVIGSSGAVSFALGLAPLLNTTLFPRILVVCSVALLIASMLTISVSILIPIGILIFVLSLKYIRRSFFIPLLLSSIFLFLMTQMNVFVGSTPLNYVLGTSGGLIVDYLAKIDLTAFAIGIGPGIFNKSFYYLPENFISDVGIMRVFVESGIVGAVPFFIFLGLLAYKAIALCMKEIQFSFLLILLGVFLLLNHGNSTTLPPFYVLFAAISAGILVAYKNQFPRSI
jgi:hypothetical protein